MLAERGSAWGKGSRLAAIVLSAILCLSGCSGNEPDNPGGDTPFVETSYSDFVAAFNSGADCPELFRIRNDMNPKDPNHDGINEALRSVGCNYISDTREG